MDRLAGVPLGAKIVRIGTPEDGDYIINSAGLVEKAKPWLGQLQHLKNYIIVVPDNPYGKFLHEVDADILAAGWEWLRGEDYYRTPLRGERYWAASGMDLVSNSGGDFGEPRIILKPRTRRVLVIECEEPWAGFPGEMTVIYRNQSLRIISSRIEEREV